MSKPGQDVVRREVASRNIPEHYFDDVVQEVFLRAVRAEEKGFEPDVLEAWVTQLVQWETRDLLRGRGRRRRHEDVAVGDAGLADRLWDPTEAPLGPDDEVVFEAVDLAIAAEHVAAIRLRLAQALSSKPYPAAGALCLVTIACDGAEPAADCPRPSGGVAQSEAAWWAGIFYSGQTSCFPSAGLSEDNTMRKRRSRALKATKDLVEEAVGG
jgi:DNA-directed RNA polymerase specialized sigma24 family protein